jgi:hypothetical protein
MRAGPGVSLAQPGMRAAVVALATAVALFCGGPASAESAKRYRPAGGEEILLVLPDAVAPAPALSPRITDAATAARHATELMRIARTTGDARFLGRAGAVIRPWQDRVPVPVAIDLIAAELAQQRHEFDAARSSLDRVLAGQPRQLEARLMRANIGLLTGAFDSARRDCLAVLQTGAAYPGTVCLASSMTGPGSLDRARRLLAALDTRGENPIAVARWRLMTEADLALRAGDVRGGIASLERAYALDRTHEEARTRLAEALLAQGETGRALALADAPNPSLARLVVGLQAAQATGHPRAADWRRRVDAALEQGRRRGAMRHEREEALLALHADRDAARALALARRNFARQKDTADLRLLVEAARAAGDREALGEARDWLAASGFEDRVVSARLAGAES